MAIIKVKRTGLLLGSAVMASTPALAACTAGPTYDEWAATDGAAGRINLDEVQKAFKESESATEFERKVNEVYEGDGLVLIRASQDGDQLTLEGFEDLDKDNEIDDSRDDLLFSIVKANDDHEMRGHGANSYYHSSFGAGNFLFSYLLLSAFLPGPYFYRTPPGYARGTLSRQRANHRSSPQYRSQVSRNSKFFRQQKGFAGSRYDQAGRNLGSTRQGYMASQKSSGAFKSSGTGVRSSWGSTGGRSGGRFGGFFRGGGGAQTVIGLDRWQGDDPA